VNKKAFEIAKLKNGDTNKDIAECLGISEQSVSNKINENDTEFKQGEIAKLVKRWNLTADEIKEIFFS
jgi:FixJ family two-component response regulator